MTMDKQVLRTIDLKDETYFQFSEQTAAILNKELRTVGEFNGIYISGPKAIDLDKEFTIPVLKTRQTGAVRRWQVREVRNLTAILYNHATGELYKGPASRDKKKRDYSHMDRPEEFPQEASTTARYGPNTKIYDLRDSLRVPLCEANCTITFISYDWKSNDISLSLINGKERPNNQVIQPEKMDKVIEASIVQSDGSAEMEINLDHIKNSPDHLQDFRLTGSFVVPVEASHIMTNTELKSVLIPVYFLMVRKNIDQSSPVTVKWYLEARLDSPVDKRAVLKASIDERIVDLSPAISKYGVKPGKYFTYVIVQGKCFGIKEIEIAK